MNIVLHDETLRKSYEFDFDSVINCSQEHQSTYQ